jgi:mRNA-degrading endonuclease toxin of MazEF toxin-antitoxin module
MGAEFTAPEGHVVAARSPDDANRVFGPALYAVVTDTLEQAEAAVRDLVPAGTTVEVGGGVLTEETTERLALVPGEAKQIG